MSMRVLIVPDKYKGTLTALEAAEAMARGWRQARPDDRLELLPMSDGGDGFGDVLGRLLHAEARELSTVDAGHRRREATWWWEPRTRTAIIESAQVIGLALLPRGLYHPFELDSLGLGTVFGAALEQGAQRCLTGIGGSATNDAGFGVARAMGCQFLNSQGQPIEQWTDLDALARIRWPRRRRWFRDFCVAVDVRNPLLGARGCSRIYGPQKGLRPDDIPQAERCLRTLVATVKKDLGLDCSRVPGAGAAGGLGFGLATLLGARLEPGFALFSRYANLPQRIRRAQLVVTGEGSLDASSLMGKGVGEVGRMTRTLGVPCLGLAGVLNERQRLRRCFTRVACLAPDLTTSDDAMARPGFWLEQLAAQSAREWSA